MSIAKNHPYYPDQLNLDDYAHILRGVFVGGCVDERNAWGIWDGVRAHAHNRSNAEWFGWVCVLEPADVLKASGRMTPTLAHEIAHLLCPDTAHGRSWKRAVTKLGFTSEIERCGLKPV